MGSNLGLPVETPATTAARRTFSPIRTLTLLAILIFLAEIVAMTILYEIPVSRYALFALVDGFIMLVLILPALYFLQLKPLVKQMEERTRAERDLRALSIAERRQRELAETLSASIQALARTLDLEQVMDTLLDFIQMIVPSDVAGVALMEDESQLAIRAVRGYGPWAGLEEYPSLPIDGITGEDLRQIDPDRKSYTLSGPILGWPAIDGTAPEPGWQWLLVPIVAVDKVIGLVGLGKAGDEPFDPDLIGRAEALVDQGAVTIQNAWLFQQVRSSSERLQSLARKLVEIQENERHHVARELHDEAGQALSILKLKLGRLQQDPDCPEHIRQKLEKLKGVADEVLEELHRLAVDLRPVALDHLGLVAALEQYAARVSSDRLSVRFKSLGLDKDRLPEEVETGLYRIVQEALANIVRHAQAGSVGILLERSDQRLTLFVEDDGVGFDPGLPEHGRRLGLVGMRERAEMFGGTLTVESHPGLGTSIIVEVPNVH